MADEINDDPIAAMAQSHITRMQELSDQNFESIKEMSGDAVSRLKKSLNLKNAVLEKALTNLGLDVEALATRK